MKKLIRTTYNPSHIDVALLIVRIAIATFMLFHGWPKLTQLCTNEEIQFADPIGLGVIFSLALTVFAEVLCSVLILIGFTTRLAVIPLIITMLVTAFIVQDWNDLSRKELSLHYLLVYGLLLVTGSGKFSVDQWLINRGGKKN